jgi:hypothetical protein
LLEPYKLRKADIDNKLMCNSSVYEILKWRVNEAIPYQYATYEWYLKASAIMTITIYLEFSNIAYGFTYAKSACLDVMFAFIGLCIQHED